MFSLLNERHMQVSRLLGFAEKTVQELRFMFEQLDIDDSETLSLSEVKLAIQSFRVSPAKLATLEEHFRKVDSDEDGEINFPQFMTLMKFMADGKLALTWDPPFTIRESTTSDHQRDILRLFPLPESFIRDLDDSGLLENVCTCTHLQPDANLRAMNEPVHNVRQLINYARNQAKLYGSEIRLV